MPSGSELHIIVPGLCGPIAETVSLENNHLIKNWIKILSRSNRRSSQPNIEDVISSIFNLSIPGDFPSASLSMLTHNSYDRSMNYMFADPVHMQADMDHALLTSGLDLDISEEESDALCEALNLHFAVDGLSFIKLDKNQWVLVSKEKIELTTTPVASAIGRNVNFIMPGGDGSGYWKQVLTEAQMLLHAHDINATRENAGQQSINSLWFYGSGALPGSDLCKVDSISSKHKLFKGLASHVQCDYLPLTESAADYISYLTDSRQSKSSVSKGSENTVNVLHLPDLEYLVNYIDVNIWSEKLEEVLNRWIYPLLAMANKNNLKVTLYPCNGSQYLFTKYDQYKFWRPVKLEQHVTHF